MEKVILYKYISIANDERYERAVDIIKNQKIYLSDGKNFNDLLELAVYDKKKRKYDRIDDLRILCLTTSAKSTLMWAHYADSNKGVCLAIEVPKEYVYPVFYTRERIYKDTDIKKVINGKNKMIPKKNLVKSYDCLDTHKMYGFIKPQLWNYEHEYRILFQNGEIKSDYSEPYLNIKVKRVYFGANMDETSSQFKELYDLCTTRGIEKQRMKPADNRNGLSSYKI